MNGTDSSENVDSCENQLTELRNERNFHFEKLTEVSRKFRETGSSCIVTAAEEMDIPEVELDFWMEKSDICQEELRYLFSIISLLHKEVNFIKLAYKQRLHAEIPKVQKDSQVICRIKVD